MEDSRFDPTRLIELVTKGTISLDGAMSPQTQQLLKQFKTSSVDMTLWWAMTPQSWSCPACGRAKPEIVRLNKNGALMCRLVEHHDHMSDVLEKRFRIHSTSRDSIIADDLAEEFAKRSAPMVSSYDNSIICNDCNNADPDAKSVIGAPDDFSFSPTEIRSFIKALPNKPHAINADEARLAWEACKPSYDLRMKIIDRIAHIAASNEHWFQRGLKEAQPQRVERTARALARHFNYMGTLDVLCGRSEPSLQNTASWRQTRYPSTKIWPTTREIEHVAKVSNKSKWGNVPDNWTCPGCHRYKAHTVRKRSKDNNWIFPLEKLCFYSEDRYERQRSTYVCADCSDTAKFVGKEAVSLAGTKHDTYANHVKISEITEIVLAQKHGRHNYKQDAIAGVLRRISLRLKMDEDEKNDWLGDD
jgi:rubredoxin